MLRFSRLLLQGMGGQSSPAYGEMKEARFKQETEMEDRAALNPLTMQLHSDLWMVRGKTSCQHAYDRINERIANKSPAEISTDPYLVLPHQTSDPSEQPSTQFQVRDETHGLWALRKGLKGDMVARGDFLGTTMTLIRAPQLSSGGDRRTNQIRNIPADAFLQSEKDEEENASGKSRPLRRPGAKMSGLAGLSKQIRDAREDTKGQEFANAFSTEGRMVQGGVGTIKPTPVRVQDAGKPKTVEGKNRFLIYNPIEPNPITKNLIDTKILGEDGVITDIVVPTRHGWNNTRQWLEEYPHATIWHSGSAPLEQFLGINGPVDKPTEEQWQEELLMEERALAAEAKAAALKEEERARKARLPSPNLESRYNHIFATAPVVPDIDTWGVSERIRKSKRKFGKMDLRLISVGQPIAPLTDGEEQKALKEKKERDEFSSRMGGTPYDMSNQENRGIDEGHKAIDLRTAKMKETMTKKVVQTFEPNTEPIFPGVHLFRIPGDEETNEHVLFHEESNALACAELFAGGLATKDPVTSWLGRYYYKIEKSGDHTVPMMLRNRKMRIDNQPGARVTVQLTVENLVDVLPLNFLIFNHGSAPLVGQGDITTELKTQYGLYSGRQA